MEQRQAPPGVMLLDDRYRLEQVRDTHRTEGGRTVTLWRGTDLQLERRIAVLVVSGRTRAARDAVAAAATRAGRVADGRCVRVLDVGTATVEGQAVTWVATEWVDAPSLTAVLRREPLSVEAACTLVRHCAEAVDAAARAGCRHGRLHPDEVLLPAGGTPRLTGIEVAAAVADVSGSEADDARGLGGLLFAALTGTWPLPGWTGLPRPDRGDGRHPRALRSGIPRELDDLTARALDGAFADAGAVARAIGRLPSRVVERPAHDRRRQRAAVASVWAWRLVPPALVAAIAAGAWVAGSDLGRVPGSARTHHVALPAVASTAASGAALEPVWSTPPSVTSFDPEGDGQENQDAAGFAVDRDPSTTWTTDRYTHDSHLGGLKAGVGLLIDLGRPRTVTEATLLLLGSGSDVELRAGDARPRAARDLQLVAARERAGSTVTWKLPAPVRARYWLVWFTNLPKVAGGYRGGVTEIALLGPRGG